MSAEQNKALARRFFEADNAHNPAMLDEVLAASFRLHFGGNPPVDREMHKQLFSMFMEAFPDLHVTVEDQIIEGSKVVNRFTVTGTHKGEFQGIPPTGKQIRIAGINILRTESGRIMEDHVLLDMMGMMQQLGVIPPSGQPKK